VLKALSQYVDHSKHIETRMKLMKERMFFDKEEQQEKKQERLENVQKSLKKQRVELEQRKNQIRKAEREKSKQIEVVGSSKHAWIVHKREADALKRQEILENNQIEKNLRFIVKKRLVEK